MKIDYDNSLLSLITSVLKHYGVLSSHRTLPELDAILSKNYKNLVVMLFDGMGTAIMEKHLPPDAFLYKHFKRAISSVFPPTTTAATIAMETGLSPIEHGWLGWSLYFDEVGANVDIFPNTLSGTGGQIAADYNVARQFIPYKSVGEKISEATSNNVGTYNVSPFSSFKSKSVRDICNTVEQLCAEDGEKYIYTYWHQPDDDMHEYGTTHKKITADISEINNEVEALCRRLEDTLVIVTADHGLVDTTWLFMADYPDIAECLQRTPSIESRAMTFFVKEEMREQFETSFKTHFSDYYQLYSKEQVLEKELFGAGTINPRSMGFIGDYLAVAFGEKSIEASPPANHEAFKAAHAGMTEDEMSVPLIVIDYTK
jgi:hypothetical protein